MRLPDEALALRLLREIGSSPTAPYREHAAAGSVLAELEKMAIPARQDQYGGIHAESRRGSPRRAIAFVAHLDHPAVEVIEASGRSGQARVRGGLFLEPFDGRLPVAVQRDGRDLPAVISDFLWDPEYEDWSPGSVRIEAETDLRVGDWAILDLPAFAHNGDDVSMRAADDLAGCAMILAALHLLAEEPRSHRVYGIFTRAEEPGLFGARLIAEDGLLSRDVLVVSLEASRALPGAQPRQGPVIRVGDAHHTFDDAAEAYLRVARERLAAGDPPIPTQRQLMYGGTCEASAFIDAGYQATGVALAVRNYHNKTASGIAPEIISLSDFRAGAALLAEAAVAAGEDAREAYTVFAGRIPERIKDRLR
jgi:putative aminopeptidase FrvX